MNGEEFNIVANDIDFDDESGRIYILTGPNRGGTVSYTHLDVYKRQDTYRTLMAADSAVMVIDGSKGVERQTIKLFKVCVMRHKMCIRDSYTSVIKKSFTVKE